tara:strand:+ start:810 stop:2276 length:1467 start_codon:yes stop_codon:yes gene_type:complete
MVSSTVWNDTKGVIVENNSIILDSLDWLGSRARMDNVTFSAGDTINFILNLGVTGVFYIQLSDQNSLGVGESSTLENNAAFGMYVAFPNKRIDFRTYGNDTGASIDYADGDNLAYRINNDFTVDVLKNGSPVYRYPKNYNAKPNTNYYQQVIGVGRGQTHEIQGLYTKTSTGFAGSVLQTISPEVQIIIDKFENNQYVIPNNVNAGIDLIKNGSITNSVFLQNFNNLVSTGIIIDKTLQPTIPEPQPAPAPAPAPAPEVKKYDVNTYRLNEFGGVFNQIFYGIDGVKLQELESKYRVTLVGSPTPSDQEIFDFYNYVDTSTNETMVSQSIGAFSLENGKVKGKILYIAESSFNPYYYNKTLYSYVQIKDQLGNNLKLKSNNLNFTETQRDETITIDEGIGNEISAVKIEFFVFAKADLTLPLTNKKDDEVIAKEVNLPPCPIGQHRNFNGECVDDGGQDIGGSTSLLGKVMGVTALLGTLALLGSKRR